MKKETVIFDEGNNGEGICKIEDVVTFVPYALKEEIVNINIIESKKKYNKAVLLKVIKKSKNRRDAICPYYYKCGGCNIMHMKYEYQLQYKKNKVLNNLLHIGNIKYDKELKIISDEENFYRNHIILHVDKKNIGFYKNNSYEIININKYIISNKRINEIISEIIIFINKYPLHNIKEIEIKSYDTVLINIKSNKFNLIKEFEKIVNYDVLYVNNKKKNLSSFAEATLLGLKFQVSCSSFYQTNNIITKHLYEYIISNINKSDTVLDLYSGVGTITLCAALKCKSAIGIEIIEDAVKCAKNNMKLNKINNVTFINGDVSKNINKIKKVNTIILDPPRSGSDIITLKTIEKIKPNKIIYVSCNSSTLARDLKILEKNYKLKELTLFDMFPNTSHVECVCVLNRR